MKHKNNIDNNLSENFIATKLHNMEMAIDIFHHNRHLCTTSMRVKDYVCNYHSNTNTNNICEKELINVVKDGIINTVEYDDTENLIMSLKKGSYKKYVILQQKKVYVKTRKAISRCINLCMMKNKPIQIIVLFENVLKHEYDENHKSRTNNFALTPDIVQSSINPTKLSTAPDKVQSSMVNSEEKTNKLDSISSSSIQVESDQSILNGSEDEKQIIKFPPLTLKSLKKMPHDESSLKGIDLSSSDNETLYSEESDDEQELGDQQFSSSSSKDTSKCSKESEAQSMQTQRSFMRIKAGDRFRVEFEAPDILEGIKRKQWFFGTAKKVKKCRDDVFTTSNNWNHQVEIAYDDSSCGTETYPSPGVELLLPCNETTKVHALTENGDIVLAYDKDVKSILAGDLVDCRVKRSHPLERARVININENEGTCSVIFINQEEDCFESNIPLKAGHIICLQKGAQGVEWLLGASFVENGVMGEIICVHCFYQNGHVSSFKVQMQGVSVIRTFAEVIHNLFSSFVPGCTQNFLDENTFIV